MSDGMFSDVAASLIHDECRNACTHKKCCYYFSILFTDNTSNFVSDKTRYIVRLSLLTMASKVLVQCTKCYFFFFFFFCVCVLR